VPEQGFFQQRVRTYLFQFGSLANQPIEKIEEKFIAMIFP